MIRSGSGAANPVGASPRGRAGTQGWVALCWALLLGGLIGCTPPAEPDGRRYEVDGIVRGIETTDGQTRLTIEHEAIPDFEDIEGETIGMEAMTMTMTVWRGARVPSTLEVGDSVRFQLDVQWDRIPSALIVGLDLVDGQEIGAR